MDDEVDDVEDEDDVERNAPELDELLDVELPLRKLPEELELELDPLRELPEELDPLREPPLNELPPPGRASPSEGASTVTPRMPTAITATRGRRSLIRSPPRSRRPRRGAR